ncbi:MULTISPECIES: phospholipid carrier-dependent glycosyltransferase [unclassified Zymobacter]|uniref:phospholipid carrier-dependent glycosyltransferase n=1 Tax=unclassified Zymobacter TaxID=3048685 RepID=UPI0039C1C485
MVWIDFALDRGAPRGNADGVRNGMAALHCFTNDCLTRDAARRGARRYGWGIVLFYLVTYIVPLGWRPLLAPDETRYAQIGSLMMRSGDLVVPHFLGLRYFEKPILGYWLNAGAQWLFGSSNFSARLSCALAAGASGLMVYRMAQLLWRDARCAACCALVYLSMLMVFCTGTYISIDAPLSLWMTAIMLSGVWAYTRDSRSSRVWGYLWIGVASGAGVMTKGFLALAIPVLVMVPWLMVTQRTRHLWTYGPLAVLAAVLTVLPWGLIVHQRDPQFWSFFFWHEHIQRFFSQTEAQHAAPCYFFVPIALLGLFPWWGSVFHMRDQSRGMAPATRRYLLLWCVMPFLFFSCARGKLAPYILPCFPAVALLVGYTLYALYLSALRWHGLWAALGGAAGLMLLLCGSGHHFDLRVDMFAYVTAIAMLSAVTLLGLGVVWRPRWVMSLALIPTALAWGIPFCMPVERLYDKAPVVFAQQHDDLVARSAVLVSNGISDAAALSWLTRRDDIVIYDAVGELAFGLQDHPERWVSVDALPGWLEQARHCGRVTMMLDNDQDSFAPTLALNPDIIDTRGTYSLLSFAARPGTDERCPVARQKPQ